MRFNSIAIPYITCFAVLYLTSFLPIATVTVSGTSAITPLDRELIDQYTLTVTVNDGGSSVSHNLAVTIIDINDEIPELEKDIYILTTDLLESSADGLLSYLYNSIIQCLGKIIMY